VPTRVILYSGIEEIDTSGAPCAPNITYAIDLPRLLRLGWERRHEDAVRGEGDDEVEGSEPHGACPSRTPSKCARVTWSELEMVTLWSQMERCEDFR